MHIDKEKTPVLPTWIEMRAEAYCELEHEEPELREATVTLLLDCTVCEVEWEVKVCRGHATMAQLLKITGGDISCYGCHRDLPAADSVRLEEL